MSARDDYPCLNSQAVSGAFASHPDDDWMPAYEMSSSEARKALEEIDRLRGVVAAAVALRLHDRAPDRTVIPSDDWWTVRRRLLLALADATDDALAAGAGEGGNP